jgi:hypothetical protein
MIPHPTTASRLRRRDFLRLGALAPLGITWAAHRPRASHGASAGAPPARAQSCILVWLDGGPSHLDTFDLKPEAPAEVRGPFAPIPTSVAGIQLSELLPETARLMHHLAVIRSMTSPLGEHNLGAHYLLTGYQPTPVLEYPSHGSVVSHLRKATDAYSGNLPGNIAVPHYSVGGSTFRGSGYLPAGTAPFSIGSDPARPNFRVADLDFYPGVDRRRVDRRRQFVQSLEQFQRQVDESQPSLIDAAREDPEFEQAYQLATSTEAKGAFDLSDEPNSVRQRYGPRTVGQSCLLARRLVERGVPFVTVNHVGWDTHQNAYTTLKEGFTGAQVPVGLVPSLDLALSALIVDLEQRGLLEQTLVVVMGEFGRTPKINTAAGRDHWPRVFSVALAGGGIAGGQVIGRSDAVGESPADRPVTPADLAATIFTSLGIDPGLHLETSDGRPVAVSAEGQVIQELLT